MNIAKESYRVKKPKFSTWVQRHGLFRILLADRYFTAFATFCVFVAFSTLLMMFKLWKVTPNHVNKEVRISGLDFLQARSLRSTARVEELKGNFTQAAVAWELARANNPGNLDSSRGLLRLCQRQSGIYSHPRLLAEAHSLLHYSRTNIADLELVSESFLHSELYQELVHLLAPIPQLLNHTLRSYLLRCRFHMGQMNEFEKLWTMLGESSSFNETANLYSLAFQAGWKQEPARGESWKSLQARALHPSQIQVLANRVLALVAFQRTDSHWGETAWNFLRAHSQASFKEALLLLKVLQLEGNKSKLVEILDKGALVPSNAREVLESIKFCSETGNSKHEELAIEWGNKHVPLDPELGILKSHRLISQKRWEELSRLGVEYRAGNRGQFPFLAFGLYLEARAMHGLGRDEQAAKIAEELSKSNSDPSRFAIEIATGLTSMGYPRHGLNLLLRAEPSWIKSLQYWTSLAVVASSARDESTLLRAAQRCYELNPNVLSSINNLAGAMLIHRTNASESLAFTARLFLEHPNHLAAKINHITALLINHRPHEAASLMASVNLDKLTRQECDQLRLAKFDLHLQNESISSAIKISTEIDRQNLFPTQRQWLEFKLQQIKPKNGS